MRNDSELLKLFAEHENICIVSHVNPDGDAIGSSLGLCHILRSMGKRASVILNGKPATRFAFLPDFCEIKFTEEAVAEQETKEFDLLICLDCSDKKRLGTLCTLTDYISDKVVIDHHVTNGDFEGFSCSMILPSYGATALILAELFEERFKVSNPEAAQCLLCGIVTDTGGFAYTNTTPETLELAACLMRAGADIAQINKECFATKSLAQTRLCARAVANLRIYEGGRVVTSVLGGSDFADCGATYEDGDCVIDVLRQLEGCVMCALLRDKAAGCKVSLRAEGKYDVAAIAAGFGGGGHVKAAGCSFDVRAAEAEPILVKSLIAQL